MKQTAARRADDDRQELLALVDAVDSLGEDTKDLALHLALYLAKAKAKGTSEQLKRMEPEFIRLVNNTVKVVQELAVVLNAARNQEKMVYEPPTGKLSKDRIESRLELIMQQCNHILATLSGVRDLAG
jgi:uncharacterized protein Yka (UPF0111/DUF47 family)